jgi:predicted O-methyltransferase YrrM
MASMAVMPTDATPSMDRPQALVGRAPALVDRVRLPLHRVRRALAEPRRLSRLHYSSVLATLHALVERDAGAVLRAHFAVDAWMLRGFEADLTGDTDFRRQIEKRHGAVRGRAIRLFGASAAEDRDPACRLLYYVTRALRPRVVVETGVFDGFSTAFILKALRDNRRGDLYSIDLPARAAVAASTDKMVFDALPPGHEAGWIIPDELRGRWSLRCGTSAALLRDWLAELGPIDMFFHDSLHTRDNMMWEFDTAWRALSPRGALVSDDVFWNRAFWAFTTSRGVQRSVSQGVGIARKRGGPTESA